MRLAQWSLALAAAVALAALSCGDDDESGPTPSPSGATPAKALITQPDAPFLADTAILVAEGTYDHGHGGYWMLSRFERRGSAAVTSTVLMSLSQSERETKNITGIAASDDLETLFVSLCVGGDCNLEGGPKRAVTEFHSSTDGGGTWQKVFELPSEWRVEVVVSNEGLAFEVDVVDSRWVRLPAGGTVSVPAAGEDPWPLLADGALVWIDSQNARFVDSNGATVYALPGAVAFTSVQALHSSGAVWVILGGDRSGSSFLGVSGSTGADFAALYQLDRSMRLGDWLAGPDTLVVDAEYSDRPRTCGAMTAVSARGNAPAVIDFRTGTIAFIADLQLCSPGARVIGVTSVR